MKLHRTVSVSVTREETHKLLKQSQAPRHNNRPPVKEIALAVALLVFGALAIVSGFFMAYNRVGGDRGHGVFFIVLGCLLFIPGFYYTRIAYYAYKGYQGFSFSNIPPV
ncbi:hypothetical protein DY000_02027582 [Brassica cretica]|uniref:Transmembrane protein 230 n=2 Tax=Brassica cretica TaxID=69181 RepID=A0ABQ7E558_BRACR|nr:hypothetical protein DY000_02027582 [Brassica cretica]